MSMLAFRGGVHLPFPVSNSFETYLNRCKLTDLRVTLYHDPTLLVCVLLGASFANIKTHKRDAAARSGTR